jgi:hypothetical protein
MHIEQEDEAIVAANTIDILTLKMIFAQVSGSSSL